MSFQGHPSIDEPFVDTNTGRMRPNWFIVWARIAKQFASVDAAISGSGTSLQSQIDTINTTLGTKAAKAGQDADETAFVVYPEDRVYKIKMRVARAFTLLETSTQTEAGTVTVTVRKNGASVGTAHSATTTENNIARSTAFAVDDDLDISLSSTSATCEGLRFSFKYEYALE